MTLLSLKKHPTIQPNTIAPTSRNRLASIGHLALLCTMSLALTNGISGRTSAAELKWGRPTASRQLTKATNLQFRRTSAQHATAQHTTAQHSIRGAKIVTVAWQEETSNSAASNRSILVDHPATRGPEYVAMQAAQPKLDPFGEPLPEEVDPFADVDDDLLPEFDEEETPEDSKQPTQPLKPEPTLDDLFSDESPTIEPSEEATEEDLQGGLFSNELPTEEPSEETTRESLQDGLFSDESPAEEPSEEVTREEVPDSLFSDKPPANEPSEEVTSEETQNDLFSDEPTIDEPTIDEPSEEMTEEELNDELFGTDDSEPETETKEPEIEEPVVVEPPVEEPETKKIEIDEVAPPVSKAPAVDPFDEPSLDQLPTKQLPTKNIEPSLDDEIKRRMDELDSSILEEPAEKEPVDLPEAIDNQLEDKPQLDEQPEDNSGTGRLFGDAKNLDIEIGGDIGAREVTEDEREQQLQQLAKERGESNKNCEDEFAKMKSDRLDDIDLSLRITGNPGEDFPYECDVATGLHQPRQWSQITYNWKAAGLCHKPLYFEQVQLERYGHSWGPYVQPIMSGVHFFGTLPILPYKMGLQTPTECVYTLGYYRPGSCAPYLVGGVPITWRAILFQGGATTGMFFTFP